MLPSLKGHFGQPVAGGAHCPFKDGDIMPCDQVSTGAVTRAKESVTVPNFGVVLSGRLFFKDNGIRNTMFGGFKFQDIFRVRE